MPSPIIPINSLPSAPGVYPILQLAGTFSTQIVSPGRAYLMCVTSTGPLTPTRVGSVGEFTAAFGSTALINIDSIQAFFDTVGSLGELYILRIGGVIAPALITQPLFITALNQFDSERDAHGFVLCPEAFYNLTSTPIRLAIYSALDAFVSQQDFQWVAAVDASPMTEYYGTGPVTVGAKTIAPSSTITPGTTIGSLSTPQATLVGSLVAEALSYNSPTGSSFFVANPAVNLFNRLVPGSILQIAAAQLRYAADSFRVAPAGVKAPLRGVVGVAIDFSKSSQSTLNGGFVNILRNISGYGVCLNGARTLYKQDSAWKFIHVRVIFNVILSELRKAYLPKVFDPIDGQGVAFLGARNIAIQKLTRYWQAGVLFGATPSAAFKVVCDSTNNPAYDLENGDLRIDVYAAPCGVSERILVGIFRTAIGQVPA